MLTVPSAIIQSHHSSVPRTLPTIPPLGQQKDVNVIINTFREKTTRTNVSLKDNRNSPLQALISYLRRDPPELVHDVQEVIEGLIAIQELIGSEEIKLQIEQHVRLLIYYHEKRHNLNTIIRGPSRDNKRIIAINLDFSLVPP